MDKILEEIKNSCIEISSIIKDYSSLELSLEINKLNKSNDKVKKLDNIANNIFLRNLQKIGTIKYICSEEEEYLIHHNRFGNFIVCFDPLDGSSNIKSNITTGSIFGIYEYDNVLHRMQIVCSGYCLYGGSTQLVIARQNVNIYKLIRNKFVIINNNFKIPKKGNIFSLNYFNVISDLKYEKLSNILKSQKYTMRYVGSFVADAHRTLIEGGIFCYPSNNKYQNGKLRLFYECIPLYYIFKKAGGIATNGIKEFDEYNPVNISPHVRTPLVLSSESEYKIFSML